LPETDDETSYNQAYETLVGADDDLVGMLAYALYKRSKRHWVIRHRQTYGREPSGEEYRTFVDAQLDPDSVKRLRDDATSLLYSYAESVVESYSPQIRQEALGEDAVRRAEEAHTALKDTLGTIASKDTFWKNLAISALGAFLYSVILALIAIILHFVGVSLIDIVPPVQPGGSAA